MSKNSHEPKKVNIPQQKINALPPQNQTNAPPKFYHNLNFSHVHTQLPNSSIAMQKKKKILHVQNSHSKIPTSSCPCTNKFSYSQNHNHKFFHELKITYPTKFFHNSKLHTHKICPYPQIYPYTYPQNKVYIYQ